MVKIIIPQELNNGQIVMTIPKEIVTERKISKRTPLSVSWNKELDCIEVKKA